MTITMSLQSKLQNKTLLASKAFIGGEWCDSHSGDTFDVMNPSTGELHATLPDLGVGETKIAIDYAPLQAPLHLVRKNKYPFYSTFEF